MASVVYDTLNKSWKSTCKVLLGSEVGDLKDFEPWLEEYIHKPRFEKSAFSGKEVELSIADYPSSSRFASFDEVDFGKKFQPLSINEIKDIDSIVEAVQDRIYYTGNLVLGTSSNVEHSSNVFDSHFVYKSNRISDSKYIAYAQDARYCECCFGWYVGSKSSYSIKSTGGNLKRCFEVLDSEMVSDAYYSTLVQNCQHCMFCFGVRSKNFVIGNLAVPKDKYEKIRKKLVSEIAEKLRKEKKVFSLLEILEKSEKFGKSSLKLKPLEEAAFNKSVIERAFSTTSKLVTGRALEGIDSYSKFLFRHVPRNVYVKSGLSGKSLVVAGFRAYLMDLYDIAPRILDQYEIDEIGKTAVRESVAENLAFDPQQLAKSLYPIAYSSLQKNAGKITNVKNGGIVISSEDCYEGCAFVQSKKCAYCYWPRESESIFGSAVLWSSAFCINCYYSKKLTRCFECDNCDSCSDTYFSHNCEGMRESMFCFNTKSLGYSIGNVQLPMDKYKKTKAAILEQIGAELEKEKDLKWDVFTLGSRK